MAAEAHQGAANKGSIAEDNDEIVAEIESEGDRIGPPRELKVALAVVQEFPGTEGSGRHGEAEEHQQAAEAAQDREDAQLLVLAKHVPAAAGQLETGGDAIEHDGHSF